MSHTQSKMIFLISSCIWEALWLCSTRSEPAPCAQSKAACLPLHHMLFPQNLGTGSKPTSTHFSLLYNYRPSDFAKKLSKFFLLCSRTLPWSGSGCPYPPSSIALPNKWAIFFFFLPRNSQFPSTNLSAFLGDCSLLPELFLQFTSPRSLFLDFNRSATCCQFVFAAGPCYP